MEKLRPGGFLRRGALAFGRGWVSLNTWPLSAQAPLWRGVRVTVPFRSRPRPGTVLFLHFFECGLAAEADLAGAVDVHHLDRYVVAFLADI